MKTTFRMAITAGLLAFAAACGGDAGTTDDAADNTILPGGEATDPPGDVGDMGTGTGDAQSGGELTGEVPDSAGTGGTTP